MPLNIADIHYDVLAAEYGATDATPSRKHLPDLDAEFRADGNVTVGAPNAAATAYGYWDDLSFVPDPVTVLEDTFTAADTTPILNRVASPVAGVGPWTETKFDSTIVSNKFRAHNNGAADTETWIDSAVSDCTITCKVVRQAGGYAGLMYRAIGTNGNQEYFYLANATDWALGSAGSGGVGTWASGTGTFTDGVEYELKVVLLGTNIKAYIDGVLVADVTSTSTYTTNTRHGVLGLVGATFDDFKVTIPGENAAVHDTFTAANGSQLEAHTPAPIAPGGAWANYDIHTDFKISSNRVVTSGDGGVGHRTVIDTGLSDFTLTCDIHTATAQIQDQGVIICAATAANEDIIIAHDVDHWYIRVDPNGVRETSAEPAMVFDTTYAVRVVKLGNLIEVYIDGVLRMDYTLVGAEIATYATGTKHGLYAFGVTDFWMDNFKVIE